MSTNEKNTKLAFKAAPSHRLYRLRLARYKAMAEAIGAYVQERDGAGRGAALNLLDVGPGSGRSMAFLEVEGCAERLKFHGVDISERRLETIYKPERWQLKCADITKGSAYSAEQFDICICEQVLEHLTHPEEVIAEMVRVLRPGGLMIVGVPTFPPGVAQLRALGVAVLGRTFGYKGGHVQTFTSGSFSRLLTAKQPLRQVACRGFRIISGGPFSPLEDRLWWYRVNRWVGRTVPWLCTEVQLVLRKTGASPA